MDKDSDLSSRPVDERLSVARVRAGRIAAARVGGLPAWVVVTQFFIGLGWLRAVAEKVIDPEWWTGGVITHFVFVHGDTTLAWYQPFVEAVILPAAPLIAPVVVVGQLVAGASLVTGRRMGLGLAAGIFLNLHFLASGAVAPSAFYLLAQGALVLWMAEQTLTLVSVKRLQLVAAIAAALVGFNLPFISTLHPAAVIDDPAIMLVFGGVLTALGCVLVARTVELAPTEAPVTM